MFEAIIFDNDGILVDSEPVWNQARKDMAAEVGVDWSHDDHKAVMGVNTQGWATYMIKRLNLEMSTDDVVAQIISRMVAFYKEHVPFMQGTVEAVNFASNLLPTAIASGSPPQLLQAVVTDTAIKGKFKVVLSADTVGRGKPHPDVYLETAKQLGVEPDKCICIEDSGKGIVSGVRAGMTVIAIPDPRFPPNPDELNQAHYQLDSLLAFPDFIQSLME